MGDRNNPIKFGPEWLRNLPREQSVSRTTVGQSAASTAAAGSGRRAAGHGASGTLPAPSVPPEGATGPPVPSTSSGPSKGNTTLKPVLKVRLAKLRYGREEMLALYDGTTEAPEELKYFDLLYTPRGKLPFALNTFEDEVRDLRGPTAGTMSSERFGASRGPGRGATGEARRGPRGTYVRHQTGQPSGRGPNPMYTNNARAPYGSGADDEPTRDRPWSANNGGPSTNRGETVEWTSKTYRRRPNHTNWRQTAREDSDEWREGRGRSHGRSDKWSDREWGEADRRPTNERSQPWGSSRWAWAGGDTHHHNEEANLPEWAVNSPEAGAGSFDSSGAFHGYSNDDSKKPKTQEFKYPLTRSQTDSSFARSKVPEDGSAEWWASEKAKKLSPKRFDVSGVIINQPTSTIASEPTPSIPPNPSQDEGQTDTKSPSDEEDLASNTEQIEGTSSNEDQQSVRRQSFSETNTFDATMTPDIPSAETSDEARGNFQSVMINPNNGLRQMHQNIVTSMESTRSQGIFQMLHSMPLQSPTVDDDPLQLIEDKIVEDMVEMTLNDSMEGASFPPPAATPPVSTVSAIHGLQVGMPNSMGLQPPVRPQLVGPTPPTQTMGVQMQSLNTALGLPIRTAAQNNIMMPMQGCCMQPSMPAAQNNSMGSDQMCYRPLLGGYQPRGQLNVGPTVNVPNVPNNTLFMNPQPMQSSEMQLPSRDPQSGMFMGQHGVPTMESMYGNMMPQIQNVSPANLWYYEDPMSVIQGPFTTKEMFNWYKSGFFSSNLMVRRAFEPVMRPLGSYGPMAFTNYVVMRNNVVNPNMAPRFPPSQAPEQLMDALWGQLATTQDSIWLNEMPTSDREEENVNNLPMCFWDPQPSSSAMTLSAGLVKDMKTEDEILAQLRSTQTAPTPPVAQVWNDSAPNTRSNSTNVSSSDDTVSIVSIPDLEKLRQLIESESLLRRDFKSDSEESDKKSEKADSEKTEEAVVFKTQPAQNDIPSEPKLTKHVISETGKPAKVKDNSSNKAKTKKAKEEKKEDAEIKNKQEEVKSEKASVEKPLPKTKKEEKQSKKELEKEKKALIKDGFTMVKGTEKSVNKELKRKVEEVKVVEDVEKKRKETEKNLLEEDKKKKQLLLSKKQQQEQQRLESMVRRAPWSAGTGGAGQPLAEIQRLEREKKLQQVREQQHMMHLIAQEQAATLAREQEMQANLAWAKNHLDNNGTGPTLAEIQAETRRQAAAAALAAQSIEEVIPLPPLQTSLAPPPAPWGSSSSAENGGLRREPIPRPAAPKAEPVPPATTDNSITSGFWDTQPCVPKPEKPQEPSKPAVKAKKKQSEPLCPRKVPSPNTEFELWCSTVLALWTSKIDVPTFVGFLKDIESPYEVKDYVKFYLGDTKDSNDFARQFLEKRSKLLRVGTVTPSDDLCSPALAVNPRAALSEYQEVKGKGKKTKKKKMLKVDARILGFSVTAAEDRINVGYIDTA